MRSSSSRSVVRHAVVLGGQHPLVRRRARGSRAIASSAASVSPALAQLADLLADSSLTWRRRSSRSAGDLARGARRAPDASSTCSSTSGSWRRASAARTPSGSVRSRRTSITARQATDARRATAAVGACRRPSAAPTRVTSPGDLDRDDAVVVEELDGPLRRSGRRRRRLVHRRGRRGHRRARPERRRQDEHDRGVRGLPARRRPARCGCSASTRRATSAGSASGWA